MTRVLHQEIVLRPVGVGATVSEDDNFAAIQTLIDAARAQPTMTGQADDAQAAVLYIQSDLRSGAVSASRSTLSWQNITLGFAGGILTASLAFLALDSFEQAPRRRRAAR